MAPALAGIERHIRRNRVAALSRIRGTNQGIATHEIRLSARHGCPAGSCHAVVQPARIRIGFTFLHQPGEVRSRSAWPCCASRMKPEVQQAVFRRRDIPENTLIRDIRPPPHRPPRRIHPTSRFPLAEIPKDALALTAGFRADEIRQTSLREMEMQFVIAGRQRNVILEIADSQVPVNIRSRVRRSSPMDGRGRCPP